MHDLDAPGYMTIHRPTIKIRRREHVLSALENEQESTPQIRTEANQRRMNLERTLRHRGV